MTAGTDTLIKNVGILLRISREAGEGRDTLLSHRTIAEEYCKERNYNYKCYEEIISGGKNVSERKELTKLLEGVKAGLYDAVFVVSTDRLSRKLGASQMIADTLAEYEIPLLTKERIYDLNSEDRLLFDIEGVMSAQELRLIAKRQKRGKRMGALRGEFVQGVAPFGYQRNDRTRKLEINLEESNIIRKIFDYSINGYSIPSIVNKLALAGYKTRTYEVQGGKNAGTIHEGKPFGLSQINTILKNPVYTGVITYHVKNKQKMVVETIMVKDAHEAIITAEDFKKAQEAVSSRLSGGQDGLAKRTRSKGQVLSILKDLVFCKKCKSKIGFRKDSKQANAIYLKACKCGNRGVSEALLLDAFQKKFRFLEQFYREEWEKAINTPQSVTKDDLEQSISELNKTAEKLKKRLEGYIEMRADGDLTREQFQKKKTETETELMRISSTIGDLQSEIESMDKESITLKYEAKIEKIKRFYELYNSEASQQDLAECNRLLKLMLDKVYYTRLTEKVTGINHSTKSLKVEKGDFIEILIASK
ncbi:recombinase family protein [Neobacillus sp. KR4-4]|uniref:recombinase family protein n=1 Tax=Neobacillus sp. KR4-4 TaxID=3344872 RepID=UPI0035C9EEE4